MHAKTPTLLLLALLAAASALAAPADTPARPAARPAPPENGRIETFNQLLQKVQANPGGTTEAEALELLRLGRALSRSYAVSLAMKGYLAHHFQPSPELMKLAAENALEGGDYRAAVSRLKTYLRAARPGEEASRAAALLYLIDIDLLGAVDDAYLFMTQEGERLRQSPAARRFDAWYLEQAAGRRDFANLARGLAMVLADKRPLEEERLYFWDHLDWLMGEIRAARPEQFAALPHLRKILPLVRDARGRSLRYGLAVANLAFQAASAGKDDAALAKDFQAVAAAARQYLEAFPTADTVQEIVTLLAGGGSFDGGRWSQQQAAKQELFVWAFEKVPDGDREALVNWDVTRYHNERLATRLQWAGLGVKYPDLFARAKGTRYVTFAYDAPDGDLIQKQAAFLRGVPSRSAAVINSLAAGGNDLAKVVDHLVRSESWYLGFEEVYELLSRTIWPAWRTLNAEGGTAPGDEVYRRALVHFGAQHLARTPIALFDREATKQYINAAWNVTGTDVDKARFVEHLRGLAWVPQAGKRQAELYEEAHRLFRDWSAWLRKEARAKDSHVKPEALEQITAIEEAFRVVMESPGDPAKAPDDMTRAVAQALVLERAKRADEYQKLVRGLYPRLRGFDAQKVPLGAATLRYLYDSRRDVDVFPIQLEALADLLKQYEPDGANRPLRILLGDVFTRTGWDWGRIPKNDVAMAQRLNQVFEQALAAWVEKGALPPELFEWFRGTRVGNMWSHKEWGEKLYARIIQKRLLERSPWRPADHPSAACASMWLVRNDAPGLYAELPVETYFDDLFIEEATRTRKLDPKYWSYGRDEKKKVAGAAARILAEFQTLPLGYNGEPVVYTRKTLEDWQWYALGAEAAARDALIARVEAACGKTRFDAFAMGRAFFSTRADCKTADGRKEFFRRMAEYVDRASKAPARLPLPYMGALANLGAAPDLAKHELDALRGIFPAAAPGAWTPGWHAETLALALHRGLVAHGRQAELYEVLPFFWKIARETRSAPLQQDLANLARDLLDRGHHDLAFVSASLGLEFLKADLPMDTKDALTAVRSKTMAHLRYFIPAKPGDRQYPMYLAQAAYLTGKTASAWETYFENRALILGMYKDLDPNFVIWLVGRHTELRQFDAAEALAREMIRWFDSVPGDFDAEIRGRLQVAHARIALGRKEYPLARALFDKIVTDPDFEGTQARRDAELAVADVLRQTSQFDEAIDRLEKLARAKDPYLQVESGYGLALVKFDQAEYAEALEYLEQVLARAPDHAAARILQAQAKIKMKKYEEPTEVEIGPVTRQRIIVPGKALRITLLDQNLRLASTNIEIRIWTDSGDEETFNLVPFGDTKTKFRGTVQTELAPAKKASGTLELLGGDTVYYDYSDAFKKAHRITDSEVHSLTVRTDARLYASSGPILTDEERETLRLEEELRARLSLERPKEEAVALSTVRPWNQVKPGNAIRVRVIDPDRSESPRKDALTVRVTATSGDTIPELRLEETGTHTGVFEGLVQTASGQPRAYASDSEPGKDPNSCLARKDYPAWVGLPNAPRPLTFSIDLNDNVALGKMTVAADVPGRRLKNFLVQTSLNARTFQTVAAWPEPHRPWDGTMQMTAVRLAAERAKGARGTLDEYREYLETGYLAHGLPRYVAPVAAFSSAAAGKPGDLAAGIRAAGKDDRYVAHYKAAFYQPRRQVRTFQIDPKGKTTGIQYFLAIDGEAAPAARAAPGTGTARAAAGDQAGPQIRESLGKGVHTIDLYVVASLSVAPEFELLCDSPEPPYMVPCPPEMFDPAKQPEIREALAQEPAKVTAAADRGSFEIDFAPAARAAAAAPQALGRARVIRLVLIDFETDAPAIGKIALTDASGAAVLPTREDFMALRENQVLEIVPGDKVTIGYEDPKVVSAGKEHHEAALTATYTNATASACFVEFSESGGRRQARYVPMRRFSPGDKITVFIRDPDMDVSDKLDTVKFTVRTSEGRPAEHVALEAEGQDGHSGVFIGGIFPVEGDPSRPSELKVARGDDVIITYTDQENTDPGIPWDRTSVVEQVWFEPPVMRLYDLESLPLSAEELKAGPPRGEERGPARKTPEDQAEEHVPVTRTLVATWPEQPHADKPAAAMIGLPLMVEILFPAIAKSPESATEIYVQTSSGRKAMGLAPDAPLDPSAAGTIRLAGRPANAPNVAAPPGYKQVLVRSNPYAVAALDDGRFTFLVPMELGPLPPESLALAEGPAAGDEPPILKIKGDDEVYVGYRYTDPQGRTHWITGRAVLKADAFFDVMDRRYQESVDGIYVGEVLYFRLIDPARDTSDEKDLVEVDLRTPGGVAKRISLTETFSHSGIFKGLARLVYRGDPQEVEDPLAMPVEYGDRLTVAYRPPAEAPALERLVEVYKGSDGEVLPFTKRFKDPTIAMQTQFTIAEAYFELAKRHRELGQESLARREILQGKRLLQEAIRDFPDTEARAQAEYLLANLALEFANDAVNEDIRKAHYMEAVNRFSDIVATYPDSIYAPKAQFKKALVFEKMGDIDHACEEYVKLSYRYPDNELVAETIARLGQYFLTKGKTMKEEADAQQDPLEREKVVLRSQQMFKTAGQVFGRLAERFPEHRLAEKTTVLAAQCYMQAAAYDDAVKAFKRVTEKPDADKDLAAEAMYWCGDAYMRMAAAGKGNKDALKSAYIMFNKCRWDHPASKWAKFARGRLTDPLLQRIDTD